MSPFKTYCALEIELWLKNNPGRVVTYYQIAELLGKACLRAASVEVAVKGFRKCGIFSLNRHVFRDDDFAIHSQHERNSTPPQPRQEEIQIEPPEEDSEEDDVEPLATIRKRILMSDTSTTRLLVNSSTPNTKKNLVKPADISPVPSCSYASTSKKGRRGATALITRSRYKSELLDALDKKIKSSFQDFI